ncbi:putative short-chain dehydrogenase/reductase family 42E member 2, partial [Scleropages formosus]
CESVLERYLLSTAISGSSFSLAVKELVHVTTGRHMNTGNQNPNMHDNSVAWPADQLTSLCVPGQNSRPIQQRTNGHAPWANGTAHRANSTAAGWYQNQDCTMSLLHGISTDWATVGKVLVTGGAGYFGHRLGKALARAGASVILLDIVTPRWDIPDGAAFHQNRLSHAVSRGTGANPIDIRDYDSLYSVCNEVDCIFHTASYGMSGPEQLNKEQVESVNVGGTSNVINVCLKRRVSRLVYTSTVNVAFVGLPIEEGDEDSAPCLPLGLHTDHYSRTKAIAERMVLEANGCPLKGGSLLQACVLRPSGIYGPEERRHLHRVMVNIERRLFCFSFGNREARMNWVHVDNLVMAHVLAAEGLTLSKDYVASGQAYFINDGESVNLFEWLTPLFERLGYSRPHMHLPVSLVYSAAFLMECLHVILRPVADVPLLFTRNEVWNIAVTHTFKIEKARRDLGFSPRRYNLADSVDQYLKTRSVQPTKPLLATHRLLMLVVLGVASILYFCWENFSLQPRDHTKIYS